MSGSKASRKRTLQPSEPDRGDAARQCPDAAASPIIVGRVEAMEEVRLCQSDHGLVGRWPGIGASDKDSICA